MNELSCSDAVVTDRLILYRPSEAYIDAIYQIHAHPETNRYNPHGPMQSVHEANDLLKHWQSEWDEKRWGYWTVALRSDPRQIIGFGGISSRPRFGGSELTERLKLQNAANLYFRFAPESWGFGYAHEMAAKALELAFNQVGLQRVFGITREANYPSRRALEKLGLIYLETSNDNHVPGAQLIYAIDADSYAKQRLSVSI